MNLTEKQKRFIDEYLIDLNATRAYKAAYPNVKKDETARTNGSRLLTNANIQVYLKERQIELQKRIEVRQDNVIHELAMIAFSNITDYVEIRSRTEVDASTGKQLTFQELHIKPTNEIDINKLSALQTIKETKYGIVIELKDKLKALELLGRHLGMFTGQQETTEDVEDDGFLEAIDSKEVDWGVN